MPRRAAPLDIDITLPLDRLPQVLTLPEAAAYLRRSTRALVHWEARGRLRIVRPAGGAPFVERIELERILAEADEVARRPR